MQDTASRWAFAAHRFLSTTMQKPALAHQRQIGRRGKNRGETGEESYSAVKARSLGRGGGLVFKGNRTTEGVGPIAPGASRIPALLTLSANPPESLTIAWLRRLVTRFMYYSTLYCTLNLPEHYNQVRIVALYHFKPKTKKGGRTAAILVVIK